MGYPQELQVSGVPLTLVAHLTKLAFKLSNSFAPLKWTATLEGRALGSHTFLSYWQLGKWANVVRESRTFTLEFVKGQRRWILKRNKAILRKVSWFLVGSRLISDTIPWTSWLFFGTTWSEGTILTYIGIWIWKEVRDRFDWTLRLNSIFEKRVGRTTYAYAKYSTVKPVLSGLHISGNQLESLNFLPTFTVK